MSKGEAIFNLSDHIPNNCTLCTHFESYADVYEDELEPCDSGYCQISGANTHVSCTHTCDKFTPVQKSVTLSDMCISEHNIPDDYVKLRTFDDGTVLAAWQPYIPLMITENKTQQ